MSKEVNNLRSKSVGVLLLILSVVGVFLWGRHGGDKPDYPDLEEIELQREVDSLKILNLTEALGLCENNVEGIKSLLNKKTKDYNKIKQDILDYEKDNTNIGNDINAITPEDVESGFRNFFSRHYSGREQ